jgi:AcrR family transcriptional regulator
MARAGDDPNLHPKVMQRPGGRSDRVLKEVVAATTAIIAEEGVPGVTVEAVAFRSGVSRTTIYRRWRTPQLLMLEALRSVMSPKASPVNDTGSLRGDLRALLDDITEFLQSADGMALFNAVFLQAHASEDEAVHKYFEGRFQESGKVIERAKARGQLPHLIDGRLVIELAASPIYFRTFFTREPVTGAFLDSIVDNVLRAAGATELPRTNRRSSRSKGA